MLNMRYLSDNWIGGSGVTEKYLSLSYISGSHECMDDI